MKGQSNTEITAGTMLNSAGKTQVLYNIVKTTVTDPSGTHDVWNYDYVEVAGTVTKQKVIDAMHSSDAQSDNSPVVPDTIATQYSDAKSQLSLSDISHLTFAQLDTYIVNNITDLASAKIYLRKLSAVVLALVKKYND